MLVSKRAWSIRERGIHDVKISRDDRVAPEVREQILAVVDAYLAGDAKGDRFVDTGNATARKRKARKVIAERKGKKVAYRYEEVPATRAHVVHAQLHERDDEGQEYNLKSGERIEPFVRITFEDCSQVSVPFNRPAKREERTRTRKRSRSRARPSDEEATTGGEAAP